MLQPKATHCDILTVRSNHDTSSARSELKNISVVSSGLTEREVQLRIFASYRSLELALLFSIYTNKEFKALESLDTYS